MAGLAVGSTPSRMVIPLHRLLNIRLTSAALISVAHRADLSLTAPVTCRALFDVGCGPRLRGRNNLKTCATLSSLWRIQGGTARRRVACVVGARHSQTVLRHDYRGIKRQE
jgi:hypothetical protein